MNFDVSPKFHCCQKGILKHQRIVWDEASPPLVVPKWGSWFKACLYAIAYKVVMSPRLEIPGIPETFPGLESREFCLETFETPPPPPH